MKNNRRDFLKNGSSLAAGISLGGLGGYATTQAIDRKTFNPNAAAKTIEWPIPDDPNTPKICLGVSMDAEEKTMHQVKQIGVDHVLMGGPKIPWTEQGLRTIMDRFKANGLTVINMMIGGHPKSIYGREGRDEEIKNM